MKPCRLLLVCSLLCGCAGSPSSAASPDAAETGSDSAGDLAAPPSDVATPQDADPPSAPVWMVGRFEPTVEPPPVAAFSISRVDNPQQEYVTLYVHAADLGLTAGMAFYVEYDPQILEFKKGTPLANLGAETGIFTKGVIKQMEPGLLSFGAARFCEAKLPWGGIDQCGGKEIASSIPVLSLEFKMKSPGQSPIRFPEEHRLLRRPDHSPFAATFIGGTVRVDPVEAQTP